MHVNKQQLDLNVEQWTGSKLGQEDLNAVYCHPGYLTYMMLKYIIWNTRLDERMLKSRLLER